MKLTIKQKCLAGLALLLIVLVVTNPSIKAFKDHLGLNTYSGLHRQSNFFVLSLYEYHGSKYIGAVGNFFYTKPEAPNRAAIKVADSVDMMASDTTVSSSNVRRVSTPINYTGPDDKSISDFLEKREAHRKHKLTIEEADSLLNGKSKKHS